VAVTTEAFVPSYSMPVHEVQGWLTVCLSQDITKKVAVLCGIMQYMVLYNKIIRTYYRNHRLFHVTISLTLTPNLTIPQDITH
jgi:hypothetical protein